MKFFLSSSSIAALTLVVALQSTVSSADGNLEYISAYNDDAPEVNSGGGPGYGADVSFTVHHNVSIANTPSRKPELGLV
jgi:hypothetical protein